MLLLETEGHPLPENQAMISVRMMWQRMQERQQQHPTGLLGRWVGEQMRRQHARETEWTIKLLGLPHMPRPC